MPKTRRTRLVDGDRLREIREDRGLSLRSLAEMSSSSPTYISLIERAQVAPSNVLIGRLATALGVSPDEFSTREPQDVAA